MELKFQHKESNYYVEGALEEKVIQISLAMGGKKFAKAFTFSDFSSEIKKNFHDLDEIY